MFSSFSYHRDHARWQERRAERNYAEAMAHFASIKADEKATDQRAQDAVEGRK